MYLFYKRFKQDKVLLEKNPHITTSYFEPAAIKLAAEQNIQLIDGEDFSKISNKQLKESLN